MPWEQKPRQSPTPHRRGRRKLPGTEGPARSRQVVMLCGHRCRHAALTRRERTASAAMLTTENLNRSQFPQGAFARANGHFRAVRDRLFSAVIAIANCHSTDTRES